MKARLAIALVLSLFGGYLAPAGEGSWTGYITDSKCKSSA